MARDGMDGALDYLVQQIQRHQDAHQAQFAAELALARNEEEATLFVVERAQRRTADAFTKLQAATTQYNLEVVKTIESTIAAKEAPV